ISHLSYQDEKIPITWNSATSFDVILKPAEATQLKEVIVNTGYQSIPKERATGSFEKIDGALINRSVSTDILSRLEGASSLYFDNRGEGRALSIRGRSTIMANDEPLIVLDNFPYDGNINNINPHDNENITFLTAA